MQARHTDRKCYFEESAQSSARYYLPYILQYHSVSNTDLNPAKRNVML